MTISTSSNQKKLTKDELYTQLFSLLDERIQSMTDKEYQEYKRKRNLI